VAAQVPNLYFSPVSGNFSRLPPVGTAFDITFVKPITSDTLVEVRLESFGFVKELDPTLQALLDANSTTANCELISRARDLHRANTDNILYQDLGRQMGTDQAPVSITHPQLYYRRAYLFGITYYYKATTQRLQQAIAQALAPLIEKGLQGQIAALPAGSSISPAAGEGLGARVKRALDSVAIAESLRQVLPPNACTAGLVLRNGEPATQLSQVVPLEGILGFFNEYLSKREVQRHFEQQLLDPFEGAIRRLRASADPAIRSQTEAFVVSGNLSPFASGTLGWLKQMRQRPNLRAADVRELDRALASATLLQSPGQEQAYAAIKQYFRLAPSGASLSTVARAAALAAASARHLRLPVTIAIASVGESSLFVQTLRERLPYHISVDGGVAYTARFKQAMPTASLNIKIWPGDMDDPQIRWEPSLLIGLGFRVPDDEENFRGFFGDESKRPLLLGLGLRNNKVAGGAVRLTVGSMLYRIKELPATNSVESSTRGVLKQAPYVGLSLNSEILGWVGEKFKAVKGILP
jgi:hypothetical protein